MKIRVATYNIHKGVSSLRSTPRVIALKRAMAQFDASIIFLQEVQGRHDRYLARFGEESVGHRHWPETSQHEYFAGESHFCAYGMNAVYDHGHHGNALLSSFNIATTVNHDVSDHAYEQRGILHCIVETETQSGEIRPIHCYVVHLGLFEGSRKRQAQMLIDCVNESARPDEPVIIAGDFNDWRNTLSDTLRKELGVVEVFDELGPRSKLGQLARSFSGRERVIPARTFPAALPFFRLDRIYVRGFKVEGAEVKHGPVWATLSDHAPIVANLCLL